MAIFRCFVLAIFVFSVSCTSESKNEVSSEWIDSSAKEQCDSLEKEVAKFCSTSNTNCLLTSKEDFKKFWELSQKISTPSEMGVKRAQEFFEKQSPTPADVKNYHQGLSKECNSMNRLNIWTALLKSWKKHPEISKEIQLSKVFRSKFIDSKNSYFLLLPLVVDEQIVRMGLDRELIPSSKEQRRSIDKLKKESSEVGKTLVKQMLKEMDGEVNKDPSTMDPKTHQRIVRMEWDATQKLAEKFNKFKAKL